DNKTQIFYSRSTDDGVSFGQSVLITDSGGNFTNNVQYSNESTAPSTAPNGTNSMADSDQYGDYMGLAASGGKVHIVWTDSGQFFPTTSSKREDIAYARLGNSCSYPAINSFSPMSGAAGTSVTITGANFTGVVSVKFNGKDAGFTVNSDTQIMAVVPDCTASGPISVTNSCGTTTSANFIVTGPNLVANPTSLTFTAAQGGANPPVQTLGLRSTGNQPNFSISKNAPWLSVSPTSGTTPSSLNVSVNIAGLAAGTYNDNITISAACASNSPVNIPVKLIVSSPSSCSYSISPTSQTFYLNGG